MTNLWRQPVRAVRRGVEIPESHVPGTRLAAAQDPSAMRRLLRALWWRHIRRYRFEICDDCGRPVGSSTGSWWHSDLWADVTGSHAGVLCPRCFTTRAEVAGLPIRWVAVLDR